jgi:hypothetical protein
MTELSAVRHLQPLEKPAPSRRAKTEAKTGAKTGTKTGTIAEIVRWLGREPQRDLIAVIAFCLIGLLLTFAVIFAVPAAGDISFVP